MNWREFFRPRISKIIIFIALILIFGFPDFMRECAALAMTGQLNPCGNTKLALNNPIFHRDMLDAVDTYAFNPFLIGAYLIILYSFLSLIYFLVNKKQINMKRVVSVTILIALYVVIMLWMTTLS